MDKTLSKFNIGDKARLISMPEMKIFRLFNILDKAWNNESKWSYLVDNGYLQEWVHESELV